MGRRHVKTEQRASQPALLVNRSKAATTDTRRLLHHPTTSRNRKAPDPSGTYLLNRRMAAPIHTGSLNLTSARNRKARQWRTLLLNRFRWPSLITLRLCSHVQHHSSRCIRRRAGESNPIRVSTDPRVIKPGWSPDQFTLQPVSASATGDAIRTFLRKTSTEWQNIP